MKTEKRSSSGINAGSMADVAFLLLIFFLVVTTIEIEKGITVKLPPWCEDCTDFAAIAPNNLFSVKVNAEDNVMVRGELVSLDQIKEKVKTFISNNGLDPDLSTSPGKAVIALQNDRNTSYKTYITVYNELKAAYSELWDEESRKTYGIAYASLGNAGKKEVRKVIPLIISESEPSDY